MNFINCTSKTIILLNKDGNINIELLPSNNPIRVTDQPADLNGVQKIINNVSVISVNYNLHNVPPMVEDTMYIVTPQIIMMHCASRPDMCSNGLIDRYDDEIVITNLICYNGWTEGEMISVED